MSKWISAVGTVSAWNSFTQEQKDYHNAGHYLTLEDSNNALPVTPTEDKYTIRCISNGSIDNDVNTPIGYTKELEINGNGYTFQCNTSGYAIRDNTNSKSSIHSFRFVSNTDKMQNFRSVLYLNTNGGGEKLYYNNIFNLNGKTDNAIYVSKHSTDNCYIYNNVIFNSSNAEYGGIRVREAGRATGKYYLESNTIVKVQIGILMQGADVYLSNNVSLACTVNSNQGTYTDVSGNEFTLSDNDAFVNSNNDNYDPKDALLIGVIPTVQGHTKYINGVHMKKPYYSGAIGLRSGSFILGMQDMMLAHI
jgi:hypothetical protein